MGHRKLFTQLISRVGTEEINKMSVTRERIHDLNRMSIDQIASFILNIGSGKWDEAELYSEKFRYHELGGVHMKTLTDDMLQVDLGITNGDHRAEILSTIRYLLVETQTNTDSLSSLPGIWTATPSKHVT